MNYMKGILLIVVLTALSFSGVGKEKESLYIQKTDSADYYLEIKDWENAERTLKDALRAEPGNVNNALLLNNLARVQQQSGRDQEALENYDIALSITPSNSMIRYNRGVLLSSLGRYEDSVVDLGYAVKGIPGDPYPLVLRGLAYLKLSKYAEAEADLQAALDRDKDNLDALELLGSLYVYKEAYDKGLSLYRRLVEKNPVAENYFKLAYSQMLAENITEADENVRKGLSLDPNYGNLYLLRAYIHQLRYETEAKEIDVRLGMERGGEMSLFRNLLK